MNRTNFKTRFFNFFRWLILKSRIYVFLRNFTINKYSDSTISKLVPNNYQFPKNKNQIIRSKSGINYKLNLHDYLGHYIYFGFNDDGQESLLSLVKPGFIILDIGTNIGNTLLELSQKLGGTGFVYGFEPDPDTFQECLINVNLNPELKSNLQVFNFGLGKEDADFILEERIKSNKGGNRILEKSRTEVGKVVKVLCADKFLFDLKVDKIDLIKIDVEGYEMHVLLGASFIIEKFHPILFIELDDNNLKDQGYSAQELLKFLEAKHYSIYHSVSGAKISSYSNFDNCHYDIIAT